MPNTPTPFIDVLTGGRFNQMLEADRKNYTPANVLPDPDANRRFSAWGSLPQTNGITNLSALEESARQNVADLNARTKTALAAGVDPTTAFYSTYTPNNTAPVVIEGVPIDIGQTDIIKKATSSTSKTKTPSKKATSSGSQIKLNTNDVKNNPYDWLNNLLPLLLAGGVGYMLAR